MKLFASLLLISGLFHACSTLDPNVCIGENNEPLNHGSKRNPEDCGGFYQCLNGKLTESQCSKGLAFNPSTGVCNYANLVTDCEHVEEIDLEESFCRNKDGSAKSNEPFLKQGTCDVIYQCVNGVLKETVCPSGLVFNPETKGCDWPHSAPPCVVGTSEPQTTHVSEASTKQVTDGVHVSTTETFLSSSSEDFSPTTAGNFSSLTKTEEFSSTVIDKTPESPPPTKSSAPLQSSVRTLVAFVVDDSGSMSNEIEGVKQWITACVNNNNPSCGTPPSSGWIVSAFNDPGVGPVMGPSKNVDDVIDFISELSANGGGDCPEYAFAGIMNALERVPGDSVCKVFFFSDATAKDKGLSNETIKLFESKQCTFIPVLTHCCHSCEDPCLTQDSDFCTQSVVDGRTSSLHVSSYSTNEESLFYNLASITGGTVYLTDKPSSPEEFLDFLEETVTLGFCPTTELAGPPPCGFTSEEDCLYAEACWDRTLKQCFCKTESC